ncbi:WYL domain-containing protein [Methylomonas rapida]
MYLEAFCHLRNEIRTFSIDRIVGDMVNVSTGKSVRVVDLCGDLMKDEETLDILLFEIKTDLNP